MDPIQLRGFKGIRPYSDSDIKDLDLLLKSDKSVGPQKENRIYVPRNWLIPSRFQPRKHFDNDSLKDLAGSIKAVGDIIQAIIVRKSGSKYEIIAGERRWRAAELANLDKVPVDIRDISDKTARAFALIENMHRENLNPIEQALSLEIFHVQDSMSHQQISEMVGISRTAVTSLLGLLDFPDEIRNLIQQGQLSLGHAKALSGLKGDTLFFCAKKIVGNSLSVRKAEELAQRIKVNKQDNTVPHQIFEEKIKEWEEILTGKFSSIVKVNLNNKGEGRVSIQLNTVDEIEWFVDHVKLQKH